MNNRKIIILTIFFIDLLMMLSCEKNPFISPDPGRLSLNLKLARGPYENMINKDDKLEIVIQYIKGHVDSSRWSYIIDKDSLKVVNLLNIDEEGNILTEKIIDIDTVWIDSVIFELDTISVTKPLVLSDSWGVYLPPLNYEFIKIKAVLEDTTMILGGKKYKIRQKVGIEPIAVMDLNVTVQENEWIVKDMFFDLKNSIARSTSEPDLYFFQPYFYIE